MEIHILALIITFCLSSEAIPLSEYLTTDYLHSSIIMMANICTDGTSIIFIDTNGAIIKLNNTGQGLGLLMTYDVGSDGVNKNYPLRADASMSEVLCPAYGMVVLYGIQAQSLNFMGMYYVGLYKTIGISPDLSTVVLEQNSVGGDLKIYRRVSGGFQYGYSLSKDGDIEGEIYFSGDG